MISYLEGKIAKVLPDSVIISVGGVGYQVYLPQRELRFLNEGETKSFFTFLHLKPNGIDLFGFLKFEEKEVFKELLSLPQVGPKTALAVLSVFNLEELKLAVAKEDVMALARVPGLGPKTARRLLREMKEKLEGVDLPEVLCETGAARNKRDLTAEALISLGYPVSQAREVVKSLEVNFECLSVEELVRLALSKVSGEVKA